jgi:hypothetical protein
VGVCQVQVECDHHTQAEVVAEDHIERTVHSNQGQPRPTKANQGQPRPMKANEGQRRPTKGTTIAETKKAGEFAGLFVLVREQIRRSYLASLISIRLAMSPE